MKEILDLPNILLRTKKVLGFAFQTAKYLYAQQNKVPLILVDTSGDAGLNKKIGTHLADGILGNAKV